MKAKRIYSTKIAMILDRPDLQNGLYAHEFLNKMTDIELRVFFDEVRNQLKTEGISTSNINTYNRAFNHLLESRTNVYNVFKNCGLKN